MRYYPNTVTLIVSLIENKFGKQTPERDKNNMPAHIIWMTQEIQSFPDTRKGSAKAGRWIGWIFREVERMGLINEARYLNELKQDVSEGHF
ncbi:MAG: hypothetical protein BMS9Abin13_655 [Patescibacteria group bacterium]|nr:MAG: hypothetical protein BMS9Abin13_655 [Patescibacteria group bacterium]